MTFKKVAERLMAVAPITGALYSCFEGKIELLLRSKIVSIGGENHSRDRDDYWFVSGWEYRLKNGLLVRTTVDEDGNLKSVMVGCAHWHNKNTQYNPKRFGKYNYHQLAVV